MRRILVTALLVAVALTSTLGGTAEAAPPNTDPGVEQIEDALELVEALDAGIDTANFDIVAAAEAFQYFAIGVAALVSAYCHFTGCGED